MRFTNFVQDEFVPCMRENLASARTVLAHFRGSWEVWAQVQTALRVRSHYANYIFEREVPFPQSTQICDFRIDPNNAQGNYIWVELKVELNSGLADLTRRFIADADKLANLNNGQRFGQNTGGAIAFAPNRANEFMQELRTQIGPGNWGAFSIWYFSANKAPERFSLSMPGNPQNAWAAVAYSPVLNG